MKTHNLVYLLALLFVTQISIGQNNFRKGEIETLNSKSIKGLINYDKLTPSILRFKKSKNDKIVVYSPKQIKGFEVGKDIFRSTASNVKSSQDKAVFVQVLVGGKKTLLTLNGTDYQSQFFIENDDEIAILRPENYKDQLAKYLIDCNFIWQSIGKATYDNESLVALFKEYYKCAGLKIKSGRYKHKLKISYGLLAGVSIASMDIQGVGFSDDIELKMENSSGYLGGVFVTFYPDLDRLNWTINNELIFINNHYKDKDVYFESQAGFRARYLDVKIAYIKMYNMIRYDFLRSKNSVFANFGISNGYTISEKSMRNTESNFPGTQVETIYDELFVKSAKYELGLIFGIGASYKRLGFETRFEIGNSSKRYDHTTELRTITSRINIFLTYKLK